MSFLDEILRELKSNKRAIDRAVTDLENEIQERNENQDRIKEQRDLIEELMAARTAPFETPTEAPKHIVGVDLAKGQDFTVIRTFPVEDRQAALRKMQDECREFFKKNLGVSFELIEIKPNPKHQPEPAPEPHQHDKFGTFKYVNGKMVRVCKCELCKKRGIANG